MRPPAEPVESPVWFWPERENQKIWRYFRKAEREKNCDLYQQLSQKPRFPLKELALIRSWQVCSISKEDFQKNKLSDFATKWFRKEILVAQKKNWDYLNPEQKYLWFITTAESKKDENERELILLEAREWSKEPENVSYSDAIKEKLYKNSPRLNPDLPDKDRGARAQEARRRREFPQALKLEQARLKDPKTTADEKFLAYKGAKQTYKLMQKNDKALLTTKQFAQFTEKQFRKDLTSNLWRKNWIEAKVMLARFLWTEGQRDNGEKGIVRAQKLLNKKPSGAFNVLLARIKEDDQHWQQASEYYEKALTCQDAEIEKILWGAGWSQWQAGNYQRASEIFQNLADKTKDFTERSKAYYWKAMCQKKLNSEEWKKTLKQVLDQDAQSYYSVLSMRELGEKFFPLPHNIETTSDFSEWTDIPKDLDLAIQWMISLKLETDFETLLTDLVQNARNFTEVKDGPTKIELWKKVFSVYQKKELFAESFKIWNALDFEFRNDLIKEAPTLLFPEPYFNVVSTAADTAKIPKEIIYSLMRQESSFDVRARSPSDAFGLMQILPHVAEGIAKKNKFKNYQTATDLFNPEIGIPLGAFEIKDLFERSKQRWIVVIGGYNAGFGKIQQWLKGQDGIDPIVWIENVPYDETRTYIKLVLRNWIFYQRMNAKEAFEFPNGLLKL